MKNRIIILISLIIIICLTGCATEDPDITGEVEEHPLNEKEIIKYVQDYMYNKYNDEVEVTVLGKYDLTHTTETRPGIDGGTSIFGGKYTKIKKGHRYRLEITNSKYNITINGNYYDGYTLYDQRTQAYQTVTRTVEIDYRYTTMKDEIHLKKEYDEFLSGFFTKFHLYKDPASPEPQVSYYNLYLYSTDYEKINEALSKLVEISHTKYYNCVYELRAFIFIDEAFYDSIDFDKCNNIDIVHLSSGQKEEDHPEWLTDLETKYHPQMILEQYLKLNLTFISSCTNLDREIFITNGLSGWIEDKEDGSWYNQDITEEDIKKFDHVVFIYEGNPQAYANSLKQKEDIIMYAHTEVYGINMDDVLTRKKEQQ